MKEFLNSQKITYNLMSFTGFKSLILFSLLVESPKSYPEIRDYWLNHPFLNETISIDTLRVYINSLKRVGCNVKRIREPGDKVSKYVILSNPFELKLTEDQINSIAKLYKTLTKNTTVHELLILERFLLKLSRYVKSDGVKEALEKVSVFRDVNMELISDLLNHCRKKEQIVITYNSPNSGKRNIELLADKLEFSSQKFYLWGTSADREKYGSYLLNRIREINEIKLHKTISPNIPTVTVGYELKTRGVPDIDDNEKLISNENGKALIEITSSSDFFITQRLLSFGQDCKILYPEDFRQKFIECLKNMRAGYYAG